MSMSSSNASEIQKTGKTVDQSQNSNQNSKSAKSSLTPYSNQFENSPAMKDRASPSNDMKAPGQQKSGEIYQDTP